MAQDAPKSKNARERRLREKERLAAGGSPEVKPTRTPRGEGGAVVSAPKRSFPEQVRVYFKGVVAESKRVSWPGKPEVIAGTVTTLFILVVFSMYMGSMDYLLNELTTHLGL